MKKALIPVLVALSLLMGGCNVKWEVVQDNFPNFHLIERRANSQDLMIGNALQNGQLVPPVAQALSDTVDYIRHLAWDYQNPTGGQTQDLTAPQTRFLGLLLNDNQASFNDAIARPDRWASCFQGAWNYNFSYRADRQLFIAVLHYQLVQQSAMIEDAVSNGSLFPSQAADLRSRIQVIREAEWDDFNQNGALDLTQDQMEELSQMLDDNYRYLRFRAQYRDRRWAGDRFDAWGQYKKDFAVTPSTLPNTPTTNNKYWDGRPPKVQNPSTQTQTNNNYWDGRTTKVQNPASNPPVQNNPNLPAPSSSGLFPWVVRTTPTFTPVPATPTRTPIPWVAPPTSTPRPAAPRPTDTPVPAPLVPTATSVPNNPAPTASATSVPKAATPTRVTRDQEQEGHDWKKKHHKDSPDEDQNTNDGKKVQKEDDHPSDKKISDDSKDSKAGSSDEKDKKDVSSEENDPSVQGQDDSEDQGHGKKTKGHRRPRSNDSDQ
jgi:hypothetical protein